MYVLFSIETTTLGLTDHHPLYCEDCKLNSAFFATGTCIHERVAGSDRPVAKLLHHAQLHALLLVQVHRYLG